MTLYNPRGEEITDLNAAWRDGYDTAVRAAINLAESEARWQTEMGMRGDVRGKFTADRVAGLIDTMRTWQTTSAEERAKGR